MWFISALITCILVHLSIAIYIFRCDYSIFRGPWTPLDSLHLWHSSAPPIKVLLCIPWLIHFNLIPLCYFLEYLDLLFLFQCISGEIVLDLSALLYFSKSFTRKGCTGLNLKLHPAKTNTFQDFYFVRIYMEPWKVLDIYWDLGQLY